MSGVLRPDKGEIRIDGKRVEIASPKAAMRLGIETIYQDASMVPTMSIARNLFVGREPLLFAVGGIGLIDHDRMRRELMKAIADVDLHLRSPDALLAELSGGQRQGVAIARAMHFKSRVLILDEPTNHLSVKETAKVLGFVRSLPAQGITTILISHNMHHVFEFLRSNRRDGARRDRIRQARRRNLGGRGFRRFVRRGPRDEARRQNRLVTCLEGPGDCHDCGWRRGGVDRSGARRRARRL